RLAPTDGYVVRNYRDARAAGISRFAQRIHERFELGHDLVIGDKKRTRLNVAPILEWNGLVAELRKMAPYRYSVTLCEPLARDGSSRNADGRLARRLASAAAIVADAILLPIGVVGMSRTERVRNGRVVLAAWILVANEQGDRRTGGPTFEHTRENFHGIGLAPLRDVA